VRSSQKDIISGLDYRDHALSAEIQEKKELGRKGRLVLGCNDMFPKRNALAEIQPEEERGKGHKLLLLSHCQGESWFGPCG